MAKPSLTVGLLPGSIAFAIEATKIKQKPARQQGLLAPATSPNKTSNRLADGMRFLTRYTSFPLKSRFSWSCFGLCWMREGQQSAVGCQENRIGNNHR